MDGQEEFIAVSERLTGHGRTELVGTGSTEDYLLTLRRAVGEETVAALLAVAGDNTVAGDTAVGDATVARDAAVGDDTVGGDTMIAEILADPHLGPVARNLIVLWYCGTWQELDGDWRRAHGAPAVETHVVSAAAYLSGLQWSVARAHAPGGNMQGFGAWSRRPDELTEGQG